MNKKLATLVITGIAGLGLYAAAAQSGASFERVPSPGNDYLGAGGHSGHGWTSKEITFTDGTIGSVALAMWDDPTGLPQLTIVQTVPDVLGRGMKTQITWLDMISCEVHCTAPIVSFVNN